MTKKYYSTNMEIDLRDLFFVIWKNKIFVLISIISFSIAFVVHSKINYTEPFKEARITLKDPETTNFHFDVKYNFYREVVKSLLSNDNLISYLKSRNDKDLEKFQKDLNKINFNYGNKIFIAPVESNSKVDNNKFYFRYPKSLNGESIFNDYVLFIAQKEMIKYLNYKNNEISFLIEKAKKNIIIAEKLGLEKPVYIINNDQKTYFDDLGFYKGTIVLYEEIKELNRLKNDLHLSNINYDVLLDKAKFYYDVDGNYSVLNMAMLGMLTGFLLSIIVLFFNFSLIKK